MTGGIPAPPTLITPPKYPDRRLVCAEKTRGREVLEVTVLSGFTVKRGVFREVVLRR